MGGGGAHWRRKVTKAGERGSVRRRELAAPCLEMSCLSQSSVLGYRYRYCRKCPHCRGSDQCVGVIEDTAGAKKQNSWRAEMTAVSVFVPTVLLLICRYRIDRHNYCMPPLFTKKTRQVKVNNAEHFHTCELRTRAQRTEVGVSQTLDTRGEGVRDRQEPQPFDFLIFFENPEGLGLEERKAQTPKKTPATPEIRLPKSPDAPPQQRMFKELGIVPAGCRNCTAGCGPAAAVYRMSSSLNIRC